MRFWRRGLAGLVVTAYALFAAPARTATTTTTFQVQLTIVAECSVAAPPTLDFGSIGSLTAVPPATTTISVTCTPTTTYNIGLDKGLYGASVTARKMQGTAFSQQVSYALTQDVAGLLNWGNTLGVDTVAGVGTGLAIPHIVYGAVPSQPTQQPDAYSDTITVTVTY